ncbi:MAG: hypothetical protein MHPSP_002907, partial [Paramarteilia canceri]
MVSMTSQKNNHTISPIEAKVLTNFVSEDWRCFNSNEVSVQRCISWNSLGTHL